MKIEFVKGENGQMIVRKIVFCDVYILFDLEVGKEEENSEEEVKEKINVSKSKILSKIISKILVKVSSKFVKLIKFKRSIKKFRKFLVEKKIIVVLIVNILFIFVYR